MNRDYRLLFGPLGAVILALGIAGLALLVPGYSHVHQTVSEIGEMDSPARVPFAVMLCCVAACILIFASGLRAVSLAAGRSTLPAYVTACLSVSVVGVAIFAFPHRLHNVFGLSEIVGYQAPLVFALAWRRDPRAKGLVAVSCIFFVLVWIALGLNMTMMDQNGEARAYLHPVFGIVQRSLFAAGFGWIAVIGTMLFRRP
jgi:hypothetical membrane protein